MLNIDVVITGELVPSVQKILHVDDHTLFADGLAQVLKISDLVCDVVSVKDGACAMEYLLGPKGHDLDLLLLDLSMPGLDGLSLMKKVIAAGICVPMAVMSASEDLNQIRQAIKLGAVAYLSKAMACDELLLALKAIHRGDTYIPERIAVALASSAVQPSKLDRALALGISQRQYAVLEHMHKGLSNKGIGAALFVTESTVKSHIQVLFQTVDANNRLDCVRKAESLGML